jgi:hypothetical protein
MTKVTLLGLVWIFRQKVPIILRSSWLRGICERHMPGYVLTISNKGPPYPLVHPLPLLLGPALLRLLSTSGYGSQI